MRRPERRRSPGVLFRERPALFTLNIPIDGVSLLSSQNHFRLVDRALSSVGIPVLPSSKARSRDEELRDRLRTALGDGVPVLEVYPYAGSKELAYEEANGTEVMPMGTQPSSAGGSRPGTSAVMEPSDWPLSPISTAS